MDRNSNIKSPSALVSLIPLAVLVIFLALSIKLFGGDAIAGGSQLSLLAASAVCSAMAMGIYHRKWSVLEDAIVENMRNATPAIIILLMIGMIAGTWMASGIIPSLIYYGLKILHPSIFLPASCVICAIVSLLTGSSWTTIATIGVALMGIGRAQGFEDGWIAGAIISGAYFGDKVSIMSDTTVLASSTAEVPLFKHIKYMMFTTTPSLIIALTVFTIAGLTATTSASINTGEIETALLNAFNISPWLLVVPILTGALISRKLPAIITLFASATMAAIAMIIAQPEIIPQIAGEGVNPAMAAFKAVVISSTTDCSILTGNTLLDDLVATSGMGGMMDTIWLITCAMCFGGVMYGSGMLSAISQIFLRIARRTVSVVGSTVTSGLFFNLTTGDQYISIILTCNLFRQLYDDRDLERRLLSRSVEDSATVTSVLIPWNSCGMAQSTVLGVATLTYLPYCIFNILSPIMSVVVAAIGYKIYKRSKNEE
ncbi:MAG: sodium:proton antiporter [Alistipes sp.]|nr:sodium:proton antiporter [Alistipes sp.]MBQ4126903.1 sodium:proton antiporter [Alistipes sp.]